MGWIKLHRKLLEHPLFMQDALYIKVFIYCLLKGYHNDTEIDGVKVNQGSFITGRFRMAEELNMAPSSCYRVIKKLESSGHISIESNNKFSIITISSWATYQEDKKGGKSKDQRAQEFTERVLKFTTYPEDLLNDFIEYWVEASDAAKKLRFEKEKAFSIDRRLSTWAKNAQRFKPAEVAGSKVQRALTEGEKAINILKGL